MKDLKTVLNLVDNLFKEEHYIESPAQLYEPIDYTMHLGGSASDHHC